MVAAAEHGGLARRVARLRRGAPNVLDAVPSSGKLGFVEAFRNVVMQIGILDDGGGDRFLAEHLGFMQTAIPFLCCEIALTDTH